MEGELAYTFAQITAQISEQPEQMIIWRTLVASPHGGPVAAVNPRKTWKRPSLARQPVGWHAFRSHGDGHEEGEAQCLRPYLGGSGHPRLPAVSESNWATVT